jgi:hypothetical protein
MRKRRENKTFRAAERIETKLRMRRLRAALRKAELEARRVKSGRANRQSRARRLEHQAPPP